MHQCATSGLVTRSGYYQFQETVPKRARAPPPATTGNIAMAHLSEDHKKLTRKILELNRVVMEQRNGAPWVEIESNNTLLVRVPNENSELQDQRYLEEGWDYDYFLGSF